MGATDQTTTTPAEARGALMSRVEDRLSGLLAAEKARWSAVDPRAAVPVEAVTVLVSAGGKRLRPAFCLSGFLAAGGDPAQEQVAVDAAAALEVLHAYALLHDDVLDDSPLRRDEPTAHARHAAEHRAADWAGEARRYGEGVASLAGDLAHVYAHRLTAALPPAAREVWHDVCTEVVIGQYLDIRVAAEQVADPELSRWTAICKSARYTIHRPLALGAAIAGRLDLAAPFEQYGAALGEAFQLRDDLIDAFGDSTVSGKPTGLDFAQQRMTLLVALAIQRDDRISGMLADQNGDGAELGRLITDMGVRGEVERRIDHLVAQARSAIATAPLSPGWRDELAHVATEVAYRQK
ncbi:polyprenyl synthetase family protein [Actinomadura sp. 6K520]|uniref:polyprenyl synthetase family protein n=1 Tax=Actinomadura sp. 6K520 TaxID=2530364 RepID=UPI0010458574|nr:polyprenyl synthetase family protein [Actinomadura sp. 6K520]TDE20020.1 polyprenyl synthetase family protein [Actinomadura sp. 6K520]